MHEEKMIELNNRIKELVATMKETSEELANCKKELVRYKSQKMQFPKELFAKNLKRLRLERGLSQTDLGIMMMCSNGYISKLESGTKIPGEIKIQELAIMLGVEKSEFFKPIETEPNGKTYTRVYN